MRKILSILFVPIIILSAVTPSHAEWIDDYFTSTVISTNPSAYKSQQMGYYTGGGFSARVPHKAESLAAISLPKIKAGCGGIDVFWGGVSFMNAEYMVKKAEGILKNAPYVLFSLAIKALSSQFGDTMEAVQAIVDQLNSLQLDECAAAKSIISFGVDKAQELMQKHENQSTNEKKANTGISKHWSNANQKTNEDPTGEANKMKDMTITDPKMKSILTGKGTILNKYVEWGWLSDSESDMMRSLFGDIEYNYNNTPGKKKGLIIIPGCGAEHSLESFIYSPLSVMNYAGKCNTTKTILIIKSQSTISALISALTKDASRKNVISGDIISYIGKSNLPMFAYMKAGAAAGEDYLLASENFLSMLTAAGYAYNVVQELGKMLDRTMSSLEMDMEKQQSDYIVETLEKLREYKENVQRKLTDFKSDYNIVIEQSNTFFSLAKSFEDRNRNIYAIRNASILERQQQ